MNHAGIENGELNIISFVTDVELMRIIEKIGLKVGKNGIIRDKEEKEISCSSCETPMELSNVGHIMPGSHYMYCKEPVCIMDYLERFG